MKAGSIFADGSNAQGAIGSAKSAATSISGAATYYRPDIDGLRAIAVLVVILCHAGLTGFGGGFIGVDVFFVISGYVVANAIWREQSARTFSLVGFYARRMRRLAPAAYSMVFATIAFAICFSFPEDAYEVLKNGAFVALFYSNIYLAKQTGYFAPTADKQALLHTWSLSVEEQFYLVFPLLLLALRNTKPYVRFGALAAIFAASLAYSEFAAAHALPRAYFSIQTRAFEFLAGTLVACVRTARTPTGGTLANELLALIGVVIIAVCTVRFSGATIMPGLAALVPCLGAALLLWAGDRSRVAAAVLASAPFAYVGRLSYALYLWHWPVLFALRRFQLTSNAWLGVGFAATAAISIATHHLIEQRVRRAVWSPQRTFLLLFLIPAAAIGGAIGIAKQTDNFARFYPGDLRRAYEQTGHSVFEGPRADVCWNKVEVTRAKDCTVGAPGGVRGVFWGDSHAYQLIEFVNQVGAKQGLALHDVTLSMCPPMSTGPSHAGSLAFQGHREKCLQHNRLVTDYILSDPEIQVVVMAAVWPNYVHEGRADGATPTLHGFMPGDRYLEETVHVLQAAGKRVVLIDDVPTIPPDLENCVSNRLYGLGAKTDCSYPAASAQAAHGPTERMFAKVLKEFPGTRVIHTYDALCDGNRCETEYDGVALYRHNDVGHLGLGGSKILFTAYTRKHPAELASIFSGLKIVEGD